MRTKLSLVLAICVSVVLGLVAVHLSLAGVADQASPELRLPIVTGSREPVLDPALVWSGDDHLVVQQLFLGLTRLDETTGDVLPMLATSWEFSPDATMVTFTLRSDITWTTGVTVTAQDVRNGILRTLNPQTQGWAYLLYVIKNAQAYNEGTITDPNQVGVEALDATHLRITFKEPAAFFLAIAAMSFTFPIPQSVIDTWGDTWTEPEHIVTNGPYRLAEWVHGDHIRLERNPAFPTTLSTTALAPQSNITTTIQSVYMPYEASTESAWQHYLNGQTDSAPIPEEQLAAVRSDPLLQNELHREPQSCTYYYGFNVTQAPFDNPLVRKAFAAAVNRQGLIDTVLKGMQQPAQTFTPPGVFGHVDGPTEGVGISYNPTQAQQWLAQAGYPNGQGLPSITLWFNTGTGQQATAEYIRDNWYATLGVSVTLQSLPWKEYIGKLYYGTGNFQIWRLSWCSDYLDAYNWLYEAVIPSRNYYGGWTNADYDNRLSQASREADATARKSLYKQAEEILVETDAVMLPLYYYVNPVATRAHLQRSYASLAERLSTWQFRGTSVSLVPTSTGTLTSPDGRIRVEVPVGGVAQPVELTWLPTHGAAPPAGRQQIGLAFELTATVSGAMQTTAVSPTLPYTLAVQYSDLERGVANEDTLALYAWDGSQWVMEPGSVVSPSANIVTATPDHFSTWALFARRYDIFLPFLARDYDPLLLYFDDFSDPSSGWYTGDDEWAKYGYQDGEYEITLHKPNIWNGIVAPAGTYSEPYSVEADMRRLSGSDSNYGLMFDWTDWEHYYLLLVDPGSQQYAIWRRNPGNPAWTLIGDYTHSPFINGGDATNHVKVKVSWSNYPADLQVSVYVNGHLLGTTGNQLRYSGDQWVGVRAGSYNDTPAVLRYDNFRVRRLSASSSAAVNAQQRRRRVAEPVWAGPAPANPGAGANGQ